jgi:hypothetical protein
MHRPTQAEQESRPPFFEETQMKTLQALVITSSLVLLAPSATAAPMMSATDGPTAVPILGAWADAIVAEGAAT